MKIPIDIYLFIAVTFIIIIALVLSGCATAEYPTNHTYHSHLELMPIQKHGRISYRCNTDFDCKVVWKRDGT